MRATAHATRSFRPRARPASTTPAWTTIDPASGAPFGLGLHGLSTVRVSGTAPGPQLVAERGVIAYCRGQCPPCSCCRRRPTPRAGGRSAWPPRCPSSRWWWPRTWRRRHGDRRCRRGVRHSPAASCSRTRPAALAAGAAGRPAGGLLLPGADRASGGGDELPRDLQRPHRRAHHGLRARLRARAAPVHPAAAAARVEARAAGHRSGASARGDRPDRRRGRHRQRRAARLAAPSACG